MCFKKKKKMKSQYNSSTEDIIEVIRRYINSKGYQHSILINGKWGSGKTYFVTKTLKERLGDDVCFIYVSLFGISSIQELDEKISAEMLIHWTGIKNFSDSALGKASGMLGKVGFNVILKKLSLTPDDLPSKTELSELVGVHNKRHFLFIFDDLERSSCDMKDLLGFINLFVEQYRAKVLLIGNKAKISVVGDGKEKGKDEGEPTVNKTGSIEESKRYETFSTYEEKLIGYTINFAADFSAIAESIVSETMKLSKIDEISVSSKEIADIIVSVFNDFEDTNLRKLQSVIGAIDHLYLEMQASRNSEYFGKLEYEKRFFLIAIRQIIYEKLKEEHKDKIDNIQMRLGQPMYESMDWIGEFTHSLIIPRESFKETAIFLSKKFEWEQKNNADPLTILQKEFHLLESVQKLIELYDELERNVESGEYELYNWGEILVLVATLETERLIEPGSFKKIVGYMDTQISAVDWDNESPALFSAPQIILFGSNLKDDYTKSITDKFTEWRAERKQSLEDNFKHRVLDFIESSDMNGLEEFLNSLRYEYVRDKRILSPDSWPVINSFLEKATAAKLGKFYTNLNTIFSHRLFATTEEKEVLDKISSWCQANQQDGDGILLMNRRLLAGSINRIIGKLTIQDNTDQY